MYSAKVVRVLVASPSDVVPERNAVVSSIVAWNSRHGHSIGLVFVPLLWEISAVPNLDPFGGQGALNKQLVDKCDAVIALFWSTLGTPTVNGRSGTVEEMERAEANGLPVHAFFKHADFPQDVSTENLTNLRNYRTEFGKKALYGPFSDLHDLRNRISMVLDSDAELFTIAEGGSNGNAADTPSERGMPATISSGSGGTFSVVFRRAGAIAVLQIQNMSLNTVSKLTVNVATLSTGQSARDLLHNAPSGALEPMEAWTTRVFVDKTVGDRIRVRISGQVNNSEIEEIIDVPLNS